MDPRRNRLKQLEMTGAFGAAFLGAGIALILREWLSPYAVPAILIGIVVHGWAMLAKRRLELQSSVIQPIWEKFAYWVCWIMLLALIGYITFSLLV